MSVKAKAALFVVTMTAWAPAASGERLTTTGQEAFVCVSWGAWREYGLASLSARGARMSTFCPRRLATGTRVVVVEEDAGGGASIIRYRRKSWFIDNQRLK
jgi:hypothetical protein